MPDIDRETREALTEAVKREWGGSGVDSSEPYLTNGASRAVFAVLAELERRGISLAPPRQRLSTNEEDA